MRNAKLQLRYHHLIHPLASRLAGSWIDGDSLVVLTVAERRKIEELNLLLGLEISDNHPVSTDKAVHEICLGVDGTVENAFVGGIAVPGDMDVALMRASVYVDLVHLIASSIDSICIPEAEVCFRPANCALLRDNRVDELCELQI